MCTIVINDILKDRNYPDAGGVIYDMLVANIDHETQIRLDMNGVEALPSMFLNMFIGRFIDEYNFAKLKEKVVFVNISKAQSERIKDYILRITTSKE